MLSKRLLPDVSRRYFWSIVRRVYVVNIIMIIHIRSTLNDIFFAWSTNVWSSSSSIRANERLERHSRIRVVRERRADGKRRRHACARVDV